MINSTGSTSSTNASQKQFQVVTTAGGGAFINASVVGQHGGRVLQQQGRGAVVLQSSSGAVATTAGSPTATPAHSQNVGMPFSTTLNVASPGFVAGGIVANKAGGVFATTSTTSPAGLFTTAAVAAPAAPTGAGVRVGVGVAQPNSTSYVLTTAAGGGTILRPSGGLVVLGEQQRRQVLLAAAAQQQQRNLRFRQHEKRYMLAAMTNDLNTYSAPRFDISALRQLQQNAIFNSTKTKPGSSSTSTIGPLSRGAHTTTVAVGQASSSKSKNTSRPSAKPIVPTLVIHKNTSSSEESKIKSPAISPRRTNGGHREKLPTRKSNATASSSSLGPIDRNYQPDYSGLFSLPLSSKRKNSTISPPGNKSFSFKKSRTSDPIYKIACKNLATEGTSLLSLLDCPNSAIAEGSNLAGTFVKGIIENDEVTMKSLFAKGEKEVQNDLKNLIMSNCIQPSRNNDNAQKGASLNGTKSYGHKYVGDDHNSCDVPGQETTWKKDGIITMSTHDVDKIAQIIARETKKGMHLFVKKSVELAYVEVVGRDAMISRPATAPVQQKISNDILGHFPQAIASFKARKNAEIESLKKKHALEIAAREKEYESFVTELILEHEKSEVLLQDKFETQKQNHSRTLESYLLASSNALKIVKKNVAMDYMM